MKRFFLLLIVIAVATLTALPAQALPKDKYDPKGPEVSAARFKQTLAKEKTAWVMFTDSNPSVPQKIREQGQRFWDTLKKKYHKQVGAFITIDTNGWPDKARAAKREILTNTYPAYALYQNGEVVNVGTMYAIIINGAPLESQYEEIFNYLKEMSFLK